jgi:CDP-4-dehydro-6-deoxyglucose reductase
VPTVVLAAREVLRATPRTRVIRLDLDRTAFFFLAGQAVTVGVPEGVRKPYSIANSPGQAARDGMLELLVPVEDTDAADPHLERVEAGAPVEVDGPFGAFVLPSRLSERDLLFVAGGTGIAPLRSMMWDALERGPDHRVVLVYSARSSDEFAFEEELQDLASARRIELHLTVTRTASGEWSGLRGRIDRQLLTSTLRTPETHCFVCGPPALVSDATALLREAGVSTERILTEKYEGS